MSFVPSSSRDWRPVCVCVYCAVSYAAIGCCHICMERLSAPAVYGPLAVAAVDALQMGCSSCFVEGACRCSPLGLRTCVMSVLGGRGEGRQHSFGYVRIAGRHGVGNMQSGNVLGCSCERVVGCMVSKSVCYAVQVQVGDVCSPGGPPT